MPMQVITHPSPHGAILIGVLPSQSLFHAQLKAHGCRWNTQLHCWTIPSHQISNIQSLVADFILHSTPIFVEVLG